MPMPGLQHELQELHVLLGEIRLAVCEDRPASPDLALLDHRTASLDELISHTEEALHHLGQDEAPASRVLGGVHRCALALQVQLWRDLLSHERMEELLGVARRHGGEWIPWVRTVRGALHRCPDHLETLSRALLRAWEGACQGAPVAVAVATAPRIQSLPSHAISGRSQSHPPAAPPMGDHLTGEPI